MYEKLVRDFPLFMDEVFEFLDKIEIDIQGLTIDHAALRFATLNGANTCLEDLKNHADVVSETIVSERSVYVCKLHNPLAYRDFSIQSVELLYPGQVHTFPRDGWEHIEVVVPVKDPQNFEHEFVEKFPNAVNGTYPYKVHIHEKLEGQLYNPTLFFEKYRGLAVKFHPYSIEEVVAGTPH